MKRILYGLLKKMKFLPPPFYVKIYYEYYTGKKLDLKNPIEFNQKIQWIKVYYKRPILTQLVDKYEVRSYVKEKVGEQYLNDLIAVYERAADVNFDELPERFVIKGVHGCHFNLIVPQKQQLNIFRAKFLLRKWMSKNQYYRGGLEWAYKNVKPKLVAETYLEEMGQEIVNDYKFYCFDGVPKILQIDLERGVKDYKCYYDLSWKKLPFTKKGSTLYEGDVKKPPNFEEMITVATKLADSFPFVRVDLYNIDGRIIFGEMTFYPSDGRIEFIPDQYNAIIGNYLTLPEIPEGQDHIT